MSLKPETLPSFHWYDKVWAWIKIELLFIYGRKRQAKLLKAKYDFIETIEIYDRNMGKAYAKKKLLEVKRNQVLFRLRKAKERCLEICKQVTRGGLTPEQHDAVLQWEDLNALYRGLTKRYNALQAMYRKIHHSKLILHETFANTELGDDMYEITEDLKSAKTTRIEDVINDCNSKLLESASELNKIEAQIAGIDDAIELDNFTNNVEGEAPKQGGPQSGKKIKTIADLRAVLLKSESDTEVSVNLLDLEEA